MRIAYVTETYAPEINGVALTAARTVGFLRERGHELLLIRPQQRGERRGEAPGEWRCAGFPIPMYSALRFGFALSATLMRRFEAFGARQVHVATEGPLGWNAVTAARRLGLPVTSDFRTNFHQYSRHYRLGWLEPLIGGYLRHFHNRTARTFAPTRETQRALVDAGFERVDVIGRGVDLERFAPARRDPGLRARWGGGPVLLHVGRLAAEKNVTLALRAFERVLATQPAARMIVIGDGPQRRRLERAHPAASFVGSLTGDALAAHYASADVFVFPSLSETFGNVTVEALASGLPVVAYDTAAAGEYVRSGLNGRVVVPGDPLAFIDAVCAIAAQPQDWATLRAAARASVVGHDWNSVLGRFESRLQENALDAASARTTAPCTA